MHKVFLARKTVHSQPLAVTWIPAHKFEGKEIWQIHPQEAREAGTTLEHILRNRQADQAARQLAIRIAPIYPAAYQAFQNAALRHQTWLVRLHCLLSTRDDIADAHPLPQEVFTLDVARTTFPKWPWKASRSDFSWRPKVPENIDPPAKWNYTPGDWREICRFAQRLRWQAREDTAVAFCELAVLFHHQGFKIHGDYEVVTMHTVACMIRQAFRMLLKDDRVQICPGHFSATFVKSEGRTLCQSAVVQASPFLMKLLFLRWHRFYVRDLDAQSSLGVFPF